MIKLKGVPASEGVAIAKLWALVSDMPEIKPETGMEPELERARFARAQEKAVAQLTQLYEKAMETDPETAEIFDVHRMMVEDPDFCDGVEAAVAQTCSAQWAVVQSAKVLEDMFLAMGEGGDEYMMARADDVRDVSGRICRILMGVEDSGTMLSENVIVAAEDLLPSQTVKLDKEHVVGYVTKNGSVTSHSAILARTMGIPCVVGVGEAFDALPREGLLAMDGSTGELAAEPDGETMADFEERLRSFGEYKEMLREYEGKSAMTKSGRRCLVCANIGSVDDALIAAKAGADGIGLFRSEFIYLDSPDFPSEETQLEAYSKVLEAFAPRQVVIRTLDLGSDKQAPYFNIPDEENPAMGYRAIRICLKQREIFYTQLRALFRASVSGNLAIMFPMITGLGQVLEIKKIVADVKEQLKSEGKPFSDSVEIGIMVETPAAAVMSDVLAKEVDFFSIGTNDLTQYTMAADRMNARVNDIFDSEDPAVLRLIEMTAKSARDAGIWVGICGEAGANTKLTQFFMDAGIDELSVAASSILKVRKAVCESD